MSSTIGRRSDLTPRTLTTMHEFRHEIFVRRLGWELPQVGIECDQYDLPDTLHVLEFDAEGRMAACARLLRTTGSYMLSELLGQPLGSASAPRDSKVWELSRFATSVRTNTEGRVLSLSNATLDLLHVVLHFAGQRGVERLVLVTSIGIERQMLRAGLHVHRVAGPELVNGELCVAIFIEVPKALERPADAMVH